MSDNLLKDMIEGKFIIYFGPGKWEGLWRNRHQLMARFALKNTVVYVEPSFNLKGIFKDFNPLKIGLFGWLKALAKPTLGKKLKNLYIYSPPLYTPIIGRFHLNKITRGIWKLLLRHKLKTLGIEKPIIWFSHPAMAHLIDGFDPGLTIYHVVDEYSAYDGIDAGMKAGIEKMDKNMAAKADLVFVVSEKLLAKRQGYNRHSYIIPNGVDFENYRKAMDSNDPLPDDIKDMPKPIIGYSGLIGSYIDIKLFEQIALRHPDWSLAIVGQKGFGPHIEAFEKLIRMENVHFLGPKSIAALPHYLKAFDVCLIPYKETEQVINSSSLKLYDYMAFGKPIVSTSFPASRELENLVYLADTPESFLCHVEAAVDEDDLHVSEKRKSYAAANTWDHRVVLASELIQKRLNSKSKEQNRLPQGCIHQTGVGN